MKILIVDDEPDMVRLLGGYLKRIAGQIDEAGDLREGLELARTKRYHLVFLDLRLRKTGKDEAFASISEFKKHGPAVVVVSGLPEPDIEQQALSAGADAFLPKDMGLNERAMMLATYAATLKRPEDSYGSESYREHVELLRRLVAEDPAEPIKTS